MLVSFFASSSVPTIFPVFMLWRASIVVFSLKGGIVICRLSEAVERRVLFWLRATMFGMGGEIDGNTIGDGGSEGSIYTKDNRCVVRLVHYYLNNLLLLRKDKTFIARPSPTLFV